MDIGIPITAAGRLYYKYTYCKQHRRKFDLYIRTFFTYKLIFID